MAPQKKKEKSSVDSKVQKSGSTKSAKSSKAIIEAERKRLSDVLETLPAMACLLTPDYHVAFANKAFRERFGESNGRRCYEFCFGRTEPCEFCESYKVLETGQPHRWQVKGEDGSVIEAYDLPFKDADGTPMVLEMDIDVTEARMKEEALMGANERSQQMLEELRINHEELEAQNEELHEAYDKLEKLGREHDEFYQIHTKMIRYLVIVGHAQDYYIGAFAGFERTGILRS